MDSLILSSLFSLFAFIDPFTLALIMGGVSAASSGYQSNKAEKGAKESRRQANIQEAAQSAQTTLNSLLAQLVPGSEEYNQLASEGLSLIQRIEGPEDEEKILRDLGSRLVSQQQQRIRSGVAATPLEARTDLAFGGYRQANLPVPEEQAVLNALRGTAPAGGGEGTPLDAIFSDLVSRAGDPNRYYESTLAPALQLAENEVRKRAATRGVLGSGLELEDLGRTGADLAIREAEARNVYRQQQLGNLGTLYGMGQGLRERGIGVERDLTNIQLGRETNLTSLMAGRAGAAEANQLGFRGGQTDYYRGGQAEAEALARAANQQFQKSLSQLGGVAAQGMAGSSLPTGSPATFAPFGGGSPAPVSVGETLALQRSGYGGQTNVNKRRLADLLSLSGGL